ncbi:ras protein [Pelomyxa schiedti]|nr:ras protein [Pelomyxa schiedti]
MVLDNAGNRIATVHKQATARRHIPNRTFFECHIPPERVSECRQLMSKFGVHFLFVHKNNNYALCVWFWILNGQHVVSWRLRCCTENTSSWRPRRRKKCVVTFFLWWMRYWYLFIFVAATIFDRLQEDEGSPEHSPDYKLKKFNVDGVDIRAQIWDTAGQEKFRNITGAYYRDATGIVLMFDVTNPESFGRVEEWLSEVARYTSSEDCVRVMIVANKIDLDSNRLVPRAEVQEFASRHVLEFRELSAIDPKLDINGFFQSFVEEIERDKPGVYGDKSKDKAKKQPMRKSPATKAPKGCCNIL